MEQEDKVEFSLDKHDWHPSPLPGQVVLVTTLDSDGKANVAPKSWISMVAFGPPPIIMFGCNVGHATASNAISGGEFVVNVPPARLARLCWELAADHQEPRSGRFERHGLTPAPSARVAPPRVAECGAHIECVTDGSREWGKEVAVFGRVVSVALDRAATSGMDASRYAHLAPFFFLEGTLAARLAEPSDVFS